MKFLKVPGPQKLLTRILADPSLPEKIRKLEPHALTALIDHVGLEDCGEIVALATTQQLERVFDDDVWSSNAPGADEEFDPVRFGLWLEIFLELGSSAAAEKIAEMDSDFLTMAFSQLVWVFPVEWLRNQVVSEARLDKVIDSTNAFEFENYILFAREPRSWDAVINLFAQLDRDNHALLHQILERCAHLSVEHVENEGDLYTVLTTEDQLKGDVAYEREKRREEQGFVTPADARAFLKLAEGPPDAEDHISPARFRELPYSGRRDNDSVSASSRSSAVPIPLANRYSRIHALLSRSSSSQTRRMEELNYLANVLVSGGMIDGGKIRTGAAAQIVLETCEQGLSKKPDANSFLEAFRVGWTKK